MTSLRGARVAALGSLFLAGACTFGWDALDPRLGDGIGTADSGLDGGAKNDAGSGGKGGSAGSGGAGVGGAGSAGAAATNDASVDVTGAGGSAGSSSDAAPDHSETVDAAPDVSPVIDAPADVPPADVVSDAPPTLCMGNTCPICPAVVYTSACCKPNNGGCGCMVNIPPGPCM